VKNLKKEFIVEGNKIEVLRGLDFKINEGELLSIIGPSGSGKSTLLSIIGALSKPSGGDILIGNVSSKTLSSNQLSSLRHEKIGFVFQRFHLIKDETALENVMMPLYYSEKLSYKEIKRKASDLLDQVGLSHRYNHKPMKMSGGECQRVAIARALVNDPDIVLADEPTGNLDSKSGKMILDLLKKINRNQGKTVILITHNPEIANETDRVIELRDGSIERIFMNGDNR